jgi:hypothetical protein
MLTVLNVDAVTVIRQVDLKQCYMGQKLHQATPIPFYCRFLLHVTIPTYLMVSSMYLLYKDTETMRLTFFSTFSKWDN